MATYDPRVDAYIDNAAEFAQPILKHLRAFVHERCPDAEETIKWRMPTFEYRGILCGMAAFKQHCAFGFWKDGLVVGDDKSRDKTAMGQLGRITSLADLPSEKVLASYIAKAMKLNEDGVKAPRSVKTPKPLVVPAPLLAALKKDKKAHAVFDAFAPSHRREYVDWIAEAKTDATRDRRIAQAIEWIGEGKQRNWKYMNC